MEITLRLDGAAAFEGEPGPDDEIRYRQGRRCGEDWARQARRHEVDEIAALQQQPWRRFRVGLATSTLPAAYCRANHLPEPATGGLYWFARDWFTIGMIDGVAAAARTRLFAV